MGKVTVAICVALALGVGQASAQQDSVRVTTFVQCPQTTLLDSLNAYEAAAAQRDSALRVFFSENIPACPTIPVPSSEEPSFLDHIAHWGPLVLTAATLAVVIFAKRDTKVIRETVIIHKDDDDQ